MIIALTILEPPAITPHQHLHVEPSTRWCIGIPLRWYVIWFNNNNGRWWFILGVSWCWHEHLPFHMYCFDVILYDDDRRHHRWLPCCHHHPHHYFFDRCCCYWRRRRFVGFMGWWRFFSLLLRHILFFRVGVSGITARKKSDFLCDIHNV